MNQPQSPPPPAQPPQGYPPAWAEADDEIDLFELWDILWDGKWWVIVSGVVCTIGAIVYALTAEEIYESSVVMLPADDSSSGGGLAALAGQFGGLASLAGISLPSGGSATTTALETLESYQFTAAFIEDNNLRPVLFPEAWDEEQQSWVIDDEDGQPPSLQKAVRRFRNMLGVATDSQSGAVTLTVGWTNPEQAADWANGLVERLNARLRARNITEAQRAIDYLQARVAETNNVDMQATLYRLIESQTQKIMLANVRDDYAFQVVDPAYAPELRSKPKRSLIVVLGGMLGGMFGVMLVFGRRVVHSYQARSAEVS